MKVRQFRMRETFILQDGATHAKAPLNELQSRLCCDFHRVSSHRRMKRARGPPPNLSLELKRRRDLPRSAQLNHNRHECAGRQPFVQLLIITHQPGVSSVSVIELRGKAD